MFGVDTFVCVCIYIYISFIPMDNQFQYNDSENNQKKVKRIALFFQGVFLHGNQIIVSNTLNQNRPITQTMIIFLCCSLHRLCHCTH